MNTNRHKIFTAEFAKNAENYFLKIFSLPFHGRLVTIFRHGLTRPWRAAGLAAFEPRGLAKGGHGINTVIFYVFLKSPDRGREEKAL